MRLMNSQSRKTKENQSTLGGHEIAGIMANKRIVNIDIAHLDLMEREERHVREKRERIIRI